MDTFCWIKKRWRFVKRTLSSYPNQIQPWNYDFFFSSICLIQFFRCSSPFPGLNAILRQFSVGHRHIKHWPSLTIRSKLTRESGTDFPIPAIPGVADNETEKLIREKDEEVRHADHVADLHHQHKADHESEHNCDYPVHSEPPAYPESPPHLIGDTALWFVSYTKSHVFWGWQWVASWNMN